MKKELVTTCVRKRRSVAWHARKALRSEPPLVPPPVAQKTCETISLLSFRFPLSDYAIDLRSVNIFLSSAQSREKFLKILQYLTKLMAYCLAIHFSHSVLAVSLVVRLETSAKALSQARRFFKFFRWMKHIQDLGAARREQNHSFRWLLFVNFALNIAADTSEDICSLERLGILGKGTLPIYFEYCANCFQLVLAAGEICAAWVRRQRVRCYADQTVGVQRRFAMANLEFSKFVCDLGKAFWDCEFSFASELLFCVCGLWAAIVSTHKNVLKALDTSK